MFPILSNHTAGHKAKKPKVTCLTCKLKGCLGRCRFQAVDCSRPPKAA
jgi:hypothetical protein